MDNNKSAKSRTNSCDARSNNKNQARPKGSARSNAHSESRKSSR